METAKSPKHLLSPLSMHHCPRQRRGAFGFRWRLAQIAKHLDRGRLSNPIGLLSSPAQKPPHRRWIGRRRRSRLPRSAPLRAELPELPKLPCAERSRSERISQSRGFLRAEIGFGSTEDRRAEAIRPHQRLKCERTGVTTPSSDVVLTAEAVRRRTRKSR